ncbi:hypothetical protein [Nitrospira sp. Kam-Ns4a]
MKIGRSGIMVSLAASLLLAAACATTEEARAPMPGAGGGAAAEPAADSLEACLARIPADATPGQRAVAEDRCKRDQAARNAVVGAGTAAATSAAASGTAGDTLDACLARIPKDASAGQRMIAEQSCQRDEAVRKGLQAPGAR